MDSRVRGNDGNCVGDVIFATVGMRVGTVYARRPLSSFPRRRLAALPLAPLAAPGAAESEPVEIRILGTGAGIHAALTGHE